MSTSLRKRLTRLEQAKLDKEVEDSVRIHALRQLILHDPTALDLAEQVYRSRIAHSADSEQIYASYLRRTHELVVAHHL